ncbi:hypothetical protein ACFQE5_22575 [Pseudonocardia hispaniensis]|uniref:SnoaL-like protein n=1 Tax=Pseudonocardia hispaniensis TaxID=904933 RepID=A0ABW1J7Y7_9PSEU
MLELSGRFFDAVARGDLEAVGGFYRDDVHRTEVENGFLRQHVIRALATARPPG